MGPSVEKTIFFYLVYIFINKSTNDIKKFIFSFFSGQEKQHAPECMEKYPKNIWRFSIWLHRV